MPTKGAGNADPISGSSLDVKMCKLSGTLEKVLATEEQKHNGMEHCCALVNESAMPTSDSHASMEDTRVPEDSTPAGGAR